MPMDWCTEPSKVPTFSPCSTHARMPRVKSRFLRTRHRSTPTRRHRPTGEIEKVWQRAADPRSVDMDRHGRIWVTARTRAPRQQPAFCKDGSINEFAKYFPMAGPSSRQIEMYDPETHEFTTIDTCFAADHNHFDENGSLVFGQNDAIGWLDTEGVRQNPRRSSLAGMDVRRWWTRMVTERLKPSGPNRINRSIPRRTTASTSDAMRTPSTPSMEACGARESATRIQRWCASSEERNPPQTCKGEVYVPPPDKMPLPGSGGVDIDYERGGLAELARAPMKF